MSVPISVAHSRLANEVKKSKRTPDPEAVAAARKVLAEAKIAAYITRVVESAPPLDEAAKARLSLIVNGPTQ